MVICSGSGFIPPPYKASHLTICLPDLCKRRHPGRHLRCNSSPVTHYKNVLTEPYDACDIHGSDIECFGLEEPKPLILETVPAATPQFWPARSMLSARHGMSSSVPSSGSDRLLGGSCRELVKPKPRSNKTTGMASRYEYQRSRAESMFTVG